jgi:hypothetical protein
MPHDVTAWPELMADNSVTTGRNAVFAKPLLRKLL